MRNGVYITITAYSRQFALHHQRKSRCAGGRGGNIISLARRNTTLAAVSASWGLLREAPCRTRVAGNHCLAAVSGSSLYYWGAWASSALCRESSLCVRTDVWVACVLMGCWPEIAGGGGGHGLVSTTHTPAVSQLENIWRSLYKGLVFRVLVSHILLLNPSVWWMLLWYVYVDGVCREWNDEEITG